MQTFIIGVAVLLKLPLVAFGTSAETPPGMAKTTFVVNCYDVGVHALEGKPGVVSVERGWSGPREVDRVVFDPRQVSVTQMENWLKDANTYIKTLETEWSKEPAKEMSQ